MYIPGKASWDRSLNAVWHNGRDTYPSTLPHRDSWRDQCLQLRPARRRNTLVENCKSMDIRNVVVQKEHFEHCSTLPAKAFTAYHSGKEQQDTHTQHMRRRVMVLICIV